MDTIKELLRQYAGDPEDPKDQKRQRILVSAAELFTEQGYRKTNMEEVARRAHVAKGTVYTYFKSKSDLLAATLAAEKLKYIERVAPLFDKERSVLERFHEYIEQAILMAAEIPLISRLFTGDAELIFALQGSFEGGETMEEMKRWVFRSFLQPLADDEGWSERELDLKVRTILTILMAAGVFLDERARNGLPIEAFATSLADLLTHGLLGEIT